MIFQALAAEIKAKMEASRKAKESMPKDVVAEQSGGRGGKQEDDNVVVLSRVDRTGAAWPVEQGEGAMPSSGRRRKKMKVSYVLVASERLRHLLCQEGMKSCHLNYCMLRWVVLERCNSSALAMELRLSCTSTSISH